MSQHAELVELCRSYIPPKLRLKAGAMAELLDMAIENCVPGRVLEFLEGKNLEETENNRMEKMFSVAVEITENFRTLLHNEPSLKKCAYAFSPNPAGFGLELVNLGVISDRCISME